MSVPANITAELTALQAQTAAAAPLASASQPTITAIQLNAAQLVTDIGTALTAAAGTLDTWTAPSDPDAIVAGITALKCSAENQSDLANMAGFVGRATKNLDQLV